MHVSTQIDTLPMLLYDYTHLYGTYIIDAWSCLLIFLLISGYKCIFPYVTRYFDENHVLFL